MEDKIAAHRAQIINNIKQATEGSTQLIQKGEVINIEQFKERLTKGEKFLTPSDIEKFNTDLRSKINKAYNPADKDALQNKLNTELSLLKSVDVDNGLGQAFRFFTQDTVSE